MRRYHWLSAMFICAVISGKTAWSQEGAAAQPVAPPPDGGILDLDLEQLSRVDVIAPSLNAEVTTVSRAESTVGKSPAAIFVITPEMIKASGAREIPEILRMAPGVNVSRISGDKWAVSIRGFNGRFSNKLLVQIDGRSVYNPLFAGVYWDVQDVVLADVERIEVIRGPGATVWGANAVNGIISIITKRAKDTQGIYAETGTGDYWSSFATIRKGGKIGDDAYFRLYGKWFERDNSIAAPGLVDPINGTQLGPPDDNWRQSRIGGRLDWEPNDSTVVTIQGEYYNGLSGQSTTQFLGPTTVPAAFPFGVISPNTSEHVRGGHVLARMTHQISEDTDWMTQVYFDQANRHEPQPQVATVGLDQLAYDFDSQLRFPWGERQEIVCGFGYRNTYDNIKNVPGVNPNPVPAPLFLGPYGPSVNPYSASLNTFSYFVQDRLTLSEDLFYMYIGSKFSHYSFADFEMQPSVRFLYTPDQRHAAWASVSRAVRFPSRADRGLSIVTPVFAIVGNPNFKSEDVLAYEMGLRGQPSDSLFWDVATYYNDYSNLSSAIANPAGGNVFQLTNSSGHEETYGFEVANTVKMHEYWQVRSAYSFLRGSTGILGTAPRNQVYLMSSRDLGSRRTLDMIYRYVDNIPSDPTGLNFVGPTGAPRYFEMDARFGWSPRENLEFYVVGRNLLQKFHNEAVAEPAGTIGSEVPREIYTGVNYRY